MINVQFSNVGRDRKAWKASLSEMSASAIYGSIKDNRALASRGIDVDYKAETNEGRIYAGGRPVGEFKVV